MTVVIMYADHDQDQHHFKSSSRSVSAHGDLIHSRPCTINNNNQLGTFPIDDD